MQKYTNIETSYLEVLIPFGGIVLLAHTPWCPRDRLWPW